MSGTSLGSVTVRLLLGRAVAYALAIGNSVLLARVLGVEQLGAYAYAVGVAALFALLPNMGIATIVTRTIAETPERGTDVVPTAMRAQSLLAALVLAVVPAFAAVLPGQPIALGYVTLAAAQLAVGTLSWPYLAVVAGHARYDRVAVAELAAAAGGTATLVAAAALGGGVATFLWAQVLAAAFAVVVARHAARPFLPRRAAPAMGLGLLFRRAFPFGATTAVQSVYTRLDVVLLGQLAPILALGLYSAAYKPINVVAFFAATVAAVPFPVIVRAAGPGLPPAFERAVRGLATVAPAMALALSGLATPLLRVLYGADFEAAGPVLVVLAWSAAANWLYAPLAVALQARGHERAWLAALSGGLVVNAAANVWAIPRWGPVGAASATLLSELVLLGAGLALLRRQVGVAPPAGTIATGVVACAAGAVTLWGLRAVGSVPATLAALAVYAGLAGRFGLVTTKDLAMVIAWLRQAGPRWSAA